MPVPATTILPADQIRVGDSVAGVGLVAARRATRSCVYASGPQGEKRFGLYQDVAITRQVPTPEELYDNAETACRTRLVHILERAVEAQNNFLAELERDRFGRQGMAHAIHWHAEKLAKLEAGARLRGRRLLA